MLESNDLEDLRQELAKRYAAKHRVDERLLISVQRPGCSEAQRLILDKDEFLDLQFHANDDSRLLTPRGESRRIRDCVDRMLERHLTFESLTSDLGQPSNLHNPGWFDKCLRLYEDFQPDKFYSLCLLGLTDPEERESPEASYSIYDGTHRSLVLGYMIIAENFEYFPVTAYLFADRERVVHEICAKPDF